MTKFKRGIVNIMPKEKIKPRDFIKGFEDITKKVVTVPAWNDMKIEMRSMRGLDRIAIFSQHTRDQKAGKPKKAEPDWDPERVFPILVVKTAFDPETGERIFEDEDVDWITTKNANAFEILVAAAMEVNGLSPTATKEIEKNS